MCDYSEAKLLQTYMLCWVANSSFEFFAVLGFHSKKHLSDKTYVMIALRFSSKQTKDIMPDMSWSYTMNAL